MDTSSSKKSKQDKSKSDDYNICILEDECTQFDLSFKIIVIGDSGVGKSCLTMKATKNHFEENSTATVGFEFFSFNMKINDKIVKLQIWDTCGQEIYRSLIVNFYRNSALAIIVYSIDNAGSFENANLWLKELKNYSNPDIQVILVGNKTDLESERKIPTEKGDIVAKQLGMQLFLETSAKNGSNAKNVFIEAGKLLYKNYQIYSSRKGSRTNSVDSTPVENKKISFPTRQHNLHDNKEKTSSSKCCK